MQPVLHAYGDRAVAEAVAALEEVNARLEEEREAARAAAEAAEAAARPKKKKKGKEEPSPEVDEPAPVSAWRVRLEEVELFDARSGKSMRELGVVVSQQPLDALAAPEVVQERLGRERVANAFPWKEMTRWPIPLAFGSGFPDRRHDPRYGILAAEERRPRGARHPWIPEQRLDRLNALRAYTAGPAFIAFAEQRRGMIRKGFDGDLSLFSDDVMAVPANRLLDLRPLATLVGGTIAWESDRLLRTGRKPGAPAARPAAK
jgi:predicted amidohydrolase YtcJ